MSDDEPWSRRDSSRLASVMVVVIGIAGVAAFLIWLNHFLDGVGF